MTKQYVNRVAPITARRYGHVLSEWLKGVGRRARSKGLQLNEERAMLYFQKRSKEGTFEDFTDSSRDWYLSVLNKSLLLKSQLNQGSNFSVLDIGCGRGGMFSWFLSNSNSHVSYFGIDQDPITVRNCQQFFGDKGEFIRGDARHLSTFFVDKVDVIVAVNLFPYINDPGGVLSQCRGLNRTQNSLLLILEPTPSVYWEKEFGGFGVHLRDPKYWMAVGKSAGWTLREVVNLAIASVGGLIFFNLANLFVFSPDALRSSNT